MRDLGLDDIYKSSHDTNVITEDYSLTEEEMLDRQNESYYIIQEENKHLQEELRKYKLENERLTQMLKITMERYEEIQNNQNDILGNVLIKKFKKSS